MSDSGEKIDWSKYVDAAYVLHYAPDKEKLRNLNDEFDRVGISGSIPVHVMYDADHGFKHLFGEAVRKYRAEHGLGGIYLPDYSVALMQSAMNALSGAICLGYNRIIVFENDVCFVGDISHVRSALCGMPKDFSLLQLDTTGVCGCDNKYPSFPDELHRDVDGWILARSENRYGGACFILSREGMLDLLNILRETGAPPDACFADMRPSRYYSRMRLVAQLVYDGRARCSQESLLLDRLDSGVFHVPGSFVPHVGCVENDDLKQLVKMCGIDFSPESLCTDESLVARASEFVRSQNMGVAEMSGDTWLSGLLDVIRAVPSYRELWCMAAWKAQTLGFKLSVVYTSLLLRAISVCGRPPGSFVLPHYWSDNVWSTFIMSAWYDCKDYVSALVAATVRSRQPGANAGYFNGQISTMRGSMESSGLHSDVAVADAISSSPFWGSLLMERDMVKFKWHTAKMK